MMPFEVGGCVGQATCGQPDSEQRMPAAPRLQEGCLHLLPLPRAPTAKLTPMIQYRLIIVYGGDSMMSLLLCGDILTPFHTIVELSLCRFRH
jgi:hypothetical protein